MGSYFVRRPLAIVFRALREVLAGLIYVVWLALWLISNVFAGFLAVLIWMMVTSTRLLYGRQAADQLRRSAAQSETRGRAWRRQAIAGFASRVGRRSNSDNDTDAPSP
jgi:hypothetical protein